MSDMNYRSTDTQPPLTKLHDWVTAARRHRRLVAVSFVGVLLGSVLGAFLLPPRYEANTKILVKHERLDPLVSADAFSSLPHNLSGVSETEMNSEVELIRSRELLEKVVTTCGLLEAPTRFWPFPSAGSADPKGILATANAVRKMQNAMKVEALPKTNLISITYYAASPEQAAQVLSTLVNLYMEKHMAVHQPAGTFEFFQSQTKQYEQGLAQAESRLVEFRQKQGVVSPEQEKMATLQKLADFRAQLTQTQAAIAEIEQRRRALEAQAGTLPSRMTTEMRVSDNPQLMGQLKVTLLNLELKRTELLQKFEPNYRLVQEVDTQLKQTRAAIQAAEKSQLREETTNRNPTYEWVDSELARARSELAAQQARAEALQRTLRSYGEQASKLDQKAAVEQDLLRDKKAQEDNYLLYQRKQEEARISNALDRSRIVNVKVADAAAVPALPSRSRGFILLAGLLAAIAVSVVVLEAAEYLNPSFRTSDDVQESLDVPVLASVSTHGS
jgi:uncharacterized protein involved in exopolysaccharide biosynthesis